MQSMRRAALGALFGVLSSTASANGFYLGLGGVYNTVNGDFDGKTAFSSTNNSDDILVPKIDGAGGGTIFGGYSFTPKAAIEFGFTSSSHDASFGNVKKSADYYAFDFNFKYHFIDTSALRPYGLVGLNVSMIDAKNAALRHNTSTVIGDVKYRGAGLNLGVGVDYFIAQHFSTGLGATYRFVQYSTAESPNASGSLPDNLSGDGYTITVNAAYHF